MGTTASRGVLTLNTGENGEWTWFESPDNTLATIIEQCSNALIGRYIAVTAFDSGELTPTVEERAAGWTKKGTVALSPKTTRANVNALPYDNYDEWFVLTLPRTFDYDHGFVSYGEFSLVPAEQLRRDADPSWDKPSLDAAIERRDGLQKRFWATLNRIRPETFIADGDSPMTVVTRNPDVAAKFAATFSQS